MTSIVEPPDDSDQDLEKAKETLEGLLEADEAEGSLGLPPEVEAMVAAMVVAREAKKERLDQLYGDEDFAETSHGIADDLSTYDQAAYTRSEVDYTTYRYNLDQPTSGPGVAATGYGTGSYGYSYSASGSWTTYGGGWSSSWYSGYKSVDTAISGVHSHVSAFVTAPGFEALEVVPDLEDVSEAAATAVGLSPAELRGKVAYFHYTCASSNEKTLIARIDSTLYEKLGIEVAQQHYIVDGISQVLAAQQYPDPLLITLLQATSAENCPIPNVLRELITEIMRVKGLDLLLEEMPGWMKRVVAFRSAMFVGAPKPGQTLASYLIYAVWEQEVETIEHEDALEVIRSIEESLRKASAYVSEDALNEYGAIDEHGKYAAKIKQGRHKILKEIQDTVITYITSSSPVGVILSHLESMLTIFEAKKAELDSRLAAKKKGASGTASEPDDPDFWSEVGTKAIKEICKKCLPLIFEHNKTFIPDPSRPGMLRHLDYPDCGEKELLPESARNRLQFSRKCAFNLKRLPGEIKTPGIVDPKKDGDEKFQLIGHHLELGISRIEDMMSELKIGMQNLLNAAGKEAEGRAGGGGMGVYGSPPGSGSGGRSHKRNKHEPLKYRGSIREASNGTYQGEDPDFSSRVQVFDCTLDG